MKKFREMRSYFLLRIINVIEGAKYNFLRDYAKFINIEKFFKFSKQIFLRFFFFLLCEKFETKKKKIIKKTDFF